MRIVYSYCRTDIIVGFLLFLGLTSNKNGNKMTILPFRRMLGSIKQSFEFQRLQRTIVFAEPFNFSRIQETIAILACLIFNEDRQRIRVGVKLISAHILRNLLILPRAQSHDIGKTIFLAIYEPMIRHDATLASFPDSASALNKLALMVSVKNVRNVA